MQSSRDEKKVDSTDIDYSGTPLPKKIHYIWVGGNTIPEEYLERILKVASVAEESGSELNIWVNNEKTILKLLQKWSMGDLDNHKAKKVAGINIRNISELWPLMKTDPFFQENNRYKTLSSWINREMVGFVNYAAASDLLRYVILLLEGGYYLDTDNKLLLEKGKKFDEESRVSGLKIAVPLGTDGVLGSGINNFIASVPQHPLMQKAIINILDILSDDEKTIVSAPFCPIELPKEFKATMTDLKRWPYKTETHGIQQFFSRRALTIESTGPGGFLPVFKDFWSKCRAKYRESDPAKLANIGKMFHPHLGRKDPFVGTIGGVKCLQKCDNTWLKTPKKTAGFDDDQVATGHFLSSPKPCK